VKVSELINIFTGKFNFKVFIIIIINNDLR
jgi:hypothetical protein